MSLRTDTIAIQQHVGVTADGIYGPVTAAAVRAHLVNSMLPLDAEKEVPATVATEFQFDERTQTNLATLTDAAQRMFRPFVAQAQAIAAAMGCDYKAISGSRTYAEQDALYAQGRTTPGNIVTKARGGYSNHNFGIALDFGVFKDGKYLDSSDPSAAHKVHAAVGQVAEQHGIEWGGNWTSFKDTPHFQIKTGLSTAQMRDKVAKGEPLV